MDPTTSNVIPPDVTEMSGPQLLAVLLNCGLLGVLSVQVYLYYLAFPEDRVYMKFLVYGIYFLELIQSVLIIETTFRIFVTKFQDVGVLDRIETIWLSIPIITAADTFVVQGFYAYRISILAKSKKVAGTIIALSFIQLGGGIALGIFTKEKKLYSLLYTPDTLASTGLWNVGSVICDLIIAVCMTYYLSRYDTSIKQTKLIVKKIVRLTIETGSLTAAVGIVTFALAISPTISLYYYQVPMGIIGKVYANSMLVLINSRMLLSSNEEEPFAIISEAGFGAPPIGDSITEADHGVFSVGSEETMRPLRISHV